MSSHSASSSTSRKGDRSCTICHRRKVRCDKQSPCSQCARGGYPCEYPQARLSTRRARKTTITDIACRIQDLERSIVAARNEATTPSRASRAASEPDSSRLSRTVTEAPSVGAGNEILLTKGSSSQYFNEILLSRVLEGEQEIQSALASPSGLTEPPSSSPFNLMGILSAETFGKPLSTHHPTKSVAQHLWKTFQENFDPCAKVIHIPTTEVLVYSTIDDPGQATAEALALCYSIYYAATITLEGSVVPNSLSEDQIAQLHQFKAGLEQAFAHANFLETPTVTLLHALAIYMSALRPWNSGRAVWTLNGLAIRAAESIGLHRDGTQLGLSIFESEIRRRLWWHLLQRDGRASEDYGLHNLSTLHLTSGVDLPRNLDDNDLHPKMEELPPARSGWTRITNLLISVVMSEYWNKLAQLSCYSSESSSTTRSQLVDELKSKADKFLTGCNPVIPTQRMTTKTTVFIVQKIDLITRQQWLAANCPEDRESCARDENMLEALEVLDAAWSMYVDELLAPYAWSLRAYPQYHTLLYVLWHLCVRPHGPLTGRAWATVERFLGKARTAVGLGHGLKWTVITTMKDKANLARMQGNNQDAATTAAAGLGSQEATAPSTDGGANNAMGDVSLGLRNDNMDWGATLQNMPDWGTMMQEFQLQPNDYNYMIL